MPATRSCIRDFLVNRLVLSTLSPLVETDSSRKCFRLIGGVLVERTVKEVEPELRINTEGVCPNVSSVCCDGSRCKVTY